MEPSKLFQPVDIEVADKDFGTLSSLLDDNGIAFTIQIDDVQKLIEEELQPVYVRSGSWHSEYHNLEEVIWENEYMFYVLLRFLGNCPPTPALSQH